MGPVRLIGAALLVVAGIVMLVALVGSLRVFDWAPAWMVGAGLAVCILALVVLAAWLFNARRGSLSGARTAEEITQELEQAGLLRSTSFLARRAFGVEEFEDEGLHYFVELTDGRVLFLSGQYLYEYEPISGDPRLSRARRFPCTAFTVRTHASEGYVVDIVCGGAVLEPEAMAPPFGSDAWAANGIPEDQQVITHVGYDELKRQQVGGARRPGAG